MKKTFKLTKSKINTYKKCPRQYKYIYVDKMESEPNEYMQLGLDVHTVAENVGKRLQGIDNVTEDDILQAFENGYIESDFDISEHMTHLYEFFVNLCINDKYKIVSTEESITDEDSSIRGIVDLVLEDPDTGELFVIDYKSSKSKPITDFRLELCFYKKLVECKYTDRTVVSACIFFTKDGKYRGFNFVEEQSKGAYVTKEDCDAVFIYKDFIYNKIDKGIFPPQKSFFCNFCSFEDQCNQDGGF